MLRYDENRLAASYSILCGPPVLMLWLFYAVFHASSHAVVLLCCHPRPAGLFHAVL